MANDNQKNIFQIVLLGAFAVMAVIGVIAIAMNSNNSTSQIVSIPIVIWGPVFDERAMFKILDELKKEDDSFELVTYIEKNPYTLYGDLLEAIATGNSPDLVIMNSSGLLPLRNKIFPISFETIPLQTFQDTFVDGADIFVLSDGIYAQPLFVDPLVLYWNKDIFTKAVVAQVPKDWDTFVELTPRLSKIVGGADLVQSAVAFGEYDNVLHAKEIISALLMQTGVSIVEETSKGFTTDLSSNEENSNSSLALRFYTSFSNPVKTVYSWNKTFVRSREAFAANRVAMYGGFVSEESLLSEINPNLNFGMSVWPQSNNKLTAVTYGKFYGVAVLRSSKNPYVALAVANVLSNSVNSKKIAEFAKLPSARRDVLTEVNNVDPFGATKIQSAIMAKSWLEPAPQSAVDEIFQKTINEIVSGTSNPDSSVTQAAADLGVLLKPYALADY